MHDRTAANFCCVPLGRLKSANTGGIGPRIRPKSLSFRVGNNVSYVASPATHASKLGEVVVPQRQTPGPGTKGEKAGKTGRPVLL